MAIIHTLLYPVKLGFLVRVMGEDPDDLCGRVVLSLCDDFDSSCL